MSDINAIAPPEATGEARELINALWDAFDENYTAFKCGDMKMEDEIKYQVLSSPGPRQYKAYADFFKLLEGGKNQIRNNYQRYMWMHDFADLKEGPDKPDKPEILQVLQNLYDVNDYNPKEITLVSGLFWGQHPATGQKIMDHFEKFHKKGDKVRILTRAKEKDVLGKHDSIFGDGSYFEMAKRIPFHYLRAGDDYIFPELPHTESSVFRLSMLFDLNILKYKKGKTKDDMLQFLNLLIEKAI